MSFHNRETPPECERQHEEFFTKKRKLSTSISLPVATTSEHTLPTNSSHVDINTPYSVRSNNGIIQKDWLARLEPRLLGRKDSELDRTTERMLTSLLLPKSDATAREMLLKVRLGDVLSPLERAYALRKPRGSFTPYRLHNPSKDLVASDIKDKLRGKL